MYINRCRFYNRCRWSMLAVAKSNFDFVWKCLNCLQLQMKSENRLYVFKIEIQMVCFNTFSTYT